MSRTKGAKNKVKTGRAPQLKSANYRLVIPDLKQYHNASPQQILKLKEDALAFFLQNQRNRDLRHYCIAVETHPTSGVPHLDVLLIYAKSVQTSLNRFDKFLKHGDLTVYRKLNQAILNYGKKEDLSPISNLPQDFSQIIKIQQLKRDPYCYLYQQMKLDPLHFSLDQYVQSNNLSQYISSWYSIKVKLKDMQVAAANILLKNKPGFKFIDRNLVEASLNPQQLQRYDSWKGYQTIVDFLNQIPLYGSDRDPKTLNLLISGAPNCGKSALIWHPKEKPNPPYNPLSSYCSIYPMGLSQWFPKYQSGTYQLIYWNEAKLTSYSYDTILKLLDGSPMDLSNKGSVSRKVDNPLVIMTSNLTLNQMIQQKFGYNSNYISLAKDNLSVRVKNVVVPKGYDLFLLQKLFHSR